MIYRIIWIEGPSALEVLAAGEKNPFNPVNPVKKRIKKSNPFITQCPYGEKKSKTNIPSTSTITRANNWKTNTALPVRSVIGTCSGISCQRLASMQRAEKNIEEMRENFVAAFNTTRQAAVTEELFDVISGFEALTSEKDSRM